MRLLTAVSLVRVQQGEFFISCELYVCRIFLYIIKYRVHKTIQMEGFYEGIEFWIIEPGLCIPGGQYFNSRRNTGVHRQEDFLWRERIKSVYSTCKSGSSGLPCWNDRGRRRNSSGNLQRKSCKYRIHTPDLWSMRTYCDPGRQKRAELHSSLWWS